MAHKQTPWFMLLLGRLNLVKVPVRVTCWYCNQTTELFPGSRETEKYWHCNNCECINARDKNGEIIDNLPPMHDASLNHPIRPARSGDTPPLIPPPERTICEDCQKKISHICKAMSEYIPDESDPKYNHYLKTANDYKRTLDEKYQLCDDCQSKVNAVIAEHKGSFHELRLFETFVWGQSNKAPSKLSKQEYWSCMRMWILLHGLVLLFCAHAYYFSHPENESKTPIEDARNLRTSLEKMLESITAKAHDQSWSSIIYDISIPLLLKIGTSLQLWLRMAACFTMGDNGYCEKDPSQGLFPLLVFWLLSFLWADWHYEASKTFFEPSRIKRWRLYLLVQRVLYVIRIGILFALRYWNSPSLSQMMMGVLAVYFTLLALSVVLVKVPSSKRDSKKVEIQAFKNTWLYFHWPLSTWSLVKKFIRPAWYARNRNDTNSLLLETEDDEVPEVIKEKKVDFGFRNHPVNLKHASFSKDKEIEVEDVAASLNGLSLAFDG